MPLPAKRKTEKLKRQTKNKMGMVSADSGTGPAKNKLNRPVAGLTKDQMTGGADKPDEVAASKPTGKKKKAAF